MWGAMALVTITTDDSAKLLIVSGEVQNIVLSRRAMRLLRDSFELVELGDVIKVRLGDDFSRSVDLMKKVAALSKCECQLEGDAASTMEAYKREDERFRAFSQKALQIRNNHCDTADFLSFKDSVAQNMKSRRLYDLQLLAAYHLAFSQNGCNFSVPGTGKTSVVYGAYAYLHNLIEDDQKHVDRLLIVSPLNAFAPWEMEYEECFGRKPSTKRLVGAMDVDEKKQYLYGFDPAEITLLSYASVIALKDELRYFLKKHRVMMVLDEAHKIKNTNGGVISETIMSIAEYAQSRVILTGTPAPNGYEDLYNLFKFIWPKKSIVKYNVGQLRDMSRSRNDSRLQGLLDSIAPYFLRIKKSDLHIPPATEHEPIVVDMGASQRRIYDYIEQRYMRELAGQRDNAFFAEMAQARIIRLMQAATNPGLLCRPLGEFLIREGIDPEKVGDDTHVMRELMKYSATETPAKFQALWSVVKDILQRGEKVIIWASFVGNIEAVQQFLSSKGVDSRALYGGTPVAGDDLDEESPAFALTREAIVREFNRSDSSFKVVVANPFAVAESISLHKACHNAIYLERTFNAAHFLQSKDRIHRYGLPDGVNTHYYYLVSKDSIDETIHMRLRQKERRLLEIIESMPIPLFDNVLEGAGDEDIKALMRDYARRSKEI